MITDASSHTREHSQTSPTEKLYLENTLLRVAGALFCHDAKRAPTRTGVITLNQGTPEKEIEIRPDPRLGQPGPLAHKLFVAIMKKHSNYGRPIRRDISFTQRELVRLMGRSWGGSASRQLARALHEIHYTFIRASFRNEQQELWKEHSFNIFPEITISRRTDGGAIEECSIVLAKPILASLDDSHFTCLNYGLLGQLGTIGQALYIRLFFHFANLYEDLGPKRLMISKRYDDICREWLGGLTVLGYKSDILKDQLGPHLAQLKTLGFLAHAALDKTVDRDAFKLTFRPGPQFFDDYQRFYKQRHQNEIQWQYEADRRDVQQPLQTVRLFIEKRTGSPLSPFAYVASKDVETAKGLIARIGFGDVPAFLDYALTQARGTNFDVQTLVGLKQYLDGFLKRRDEQSAAHAADRERRARQLGEAEHDAYEHYRREAARSVLQTLAIEVQQSLRAQVGEGTGPFAERFDEIKLLALVANGYGQHILSFDAWRSTRAA